MDTNNSGATTSGEATTVTGDPRELWQLQLQPESRQRIVNKIMDTLKRHLPCHGQEGLNEIRMIAARFDGLTRHAPFSGEEALNELWEIAIRYEGKFYIAASNESDYLRRIYLKLLKLEVMSQNIANTFGKCSNLPNP
ncbi:Mediator complex subunit 15, partial [Theobroma cacao]